MDSQFDITEVPFHRLFGLRRAEPGGEALLALPDFADLHNHLGTVHASAQLALAEATSGEFLFRHLPPIEGLLPVVRRIEAKFKHAALGSLTSRAHVDPDRLAALPEELARQGRAWVEVKIEVRDAAGAVTLMATVEWFLAVPAAEK